MKWLLAVAVVPCLHAANTPAEFFETKVRPVLAKNCFSCHTQSKLGGLAMTSREDLLKGGKSGPAVVAGEPDKSLLVQALTQQHERLKMPPSGKLEESAIASIKAWIRDGAVWPEGPKGKQYAVSTEQRQWWAFQPVRNPAVPAVKNKSWVKTPIDAFLLAALESKNVKPRGPGRPAHTDSPGDAGPDGAAAHGRRD
jgi:hypothetical protein